MEIDYTLLDHLLTKMLTGYKELQNRAVEGLKLVPTTMTSLQREQNFT